MPVKGRADATLTDGTPLFSTARVSSGMLPVMTPVVGFSENPDGRFGDSNVKAPRAGPCLTTTGVEDVAAVTGPRKSTTG